MQWRASILILCTLLPLMATAQTGSLIFERSKLSIESPPIHDEATSVTMAHAPIPYTIELRPESALNLEYIHALNTLKANEGVLIAFSSPAIASLPPMKVYTQVDALFITPEGIIAQIFPGIVLGELTQDVRPREPMGGFLFIKSGEAARLGINPLDNVVGPPFSARPVTREFVPAAAPR
jgi:hypothetical protein